MSAILYLGGKTWEFMIPILGIIMLIWGHFKHGTVYLAFRHLKKKNFQKAEQLLSKIKNPELLDKSQKGYFYMSMGFIELHKQNLDEGNQNLTKALEIGLRTENDQALVNLQLAGISYQKGNFQKATHFLEQAKSCQHKPLIAQEIQRLETDLRNHDS